MPPKPTLEDYLGVVADVGKQENLEYSLVFKGRLVDNWHILGLKREEAQERVPYHAELKGQLGKIATRYYFVEFWEWTLLFVDSIEAATHFKMKYGYGNYTKGELEFFEAIRATRPEIPEPPS